MIFVFSILDSPEQNAPDDVERLIRVGLPFEPHLIVYGCTWNDIRNEHYRVSMGRHPLEAQFGAYQRFADSPSYLLRVLWPRWKSFQPSHQRLYP